MLLNLHVKNIALIDEVDIDFGEGLNILTGETGAGKSIIIDSVNFALGARMPKDVVREDATDAVCELVFEVSDEDTLRALESLDVYPDEGRVILTRKISKGKSQLKCNGDGITTSMARDIAALLIDIHGQHEHQSLLYKNNHLKILDKYCYGDISPLLECYRSAYKEYRDKSRELEEAKSQAGSKEMDEDYCRFVVNEISGAGLKPGEDEELEENFRRMNSARKIAESLQAVREYLQDDESGAAINVSRAAGYARTIAGLDKQAEDLYSQLSSIEDLIQDFERSLSDYESGLSFSQEEYIACEERLNEINRLKMKYAPTIEGILKHLEDEENKLSKISDYGSYLENLEMEISELHSKVIDLCYKISDVRRKEAVSLSEQVVKSLEELNFLDARFEIAIESDEEKISENGFDDVEFLISTNPGEKIKPLSLVASGGELSRIMLALKTVFADKDLIGTLIFDEIDTGISGVTAQLVADKMSYISGLHQVICVTHLPQIASHANNHYLIEKNVFDGRTTTNVRALGYDDSVNELARMLSGTQITEATLMNAKEMKDASVSI